MRVAAWALLACAACVTGTSPSPDAGSEPCVQALPGQCVAPAPTYSGGVSAILQAGCVGCHNDDADASGSPLTTYEQAYQLRAAILVQVDSCAMPPPDAGQLSDSDRAELLDWLACEAPQ